MPALVKTTATVALLALSVGCAKPVEPPPAATQPDAPPRAMVGGFTPIDIPAAPGSGQPHIAVDGSGAFLMSWTEPDGELHSLKMARLEGETWGGAQLVARRSDFFVNWADFPSIAVSGDATYAHWLQRSAPGTYNYDVVVSISRDGGATWGEPFVVHKDGVKAEHGFASMLPLPDNRVGIAWLDGREMGGDHGEGHGDMSLRYAVLSPDGTISDEAVLDTRTCECCATTISATPSGPLVAWRDRSAEEVRDISFSRMVGGEWSSPAAIHDDGWTIAGCPVNGPQSDALADRVVMAWFSGASDTGTVRAAFSSDGGASFGAPRTIATGTSVVGYVDVVLLSEDRAFVVWMNDEPEQLELSAREVSVDGELTSPIVLATTTRGRTGFPRMAGSGDQILLAWNEKGETPGIRAARASISR